MTKSLPFLGATLSAMAILAIAPLPAHANTVKLDAQLGQSAVVAASGKRVYLRISLEGLALAGENKRASTNVGLVSCLSP